MTNNIQFKIIKTGYSFIDDQGAQKADCTISLIRTDAHIIIVDTGGPCDKDYLIERLQKENIKVEDINFVVCTHGHSDHVGNLNLFPTAIICVSHDICKEDLYFSNALGEGKPYILCEGVKLIPTPGHTGSDISVVIEGTSEGTVVFAGAQKADCTISLIRTDAHIIIVDTGGPCDKDYLIERLQKENIKVEDINFVVCTHGHSDHVGNLNLFPTAIICVSHDICKEDLYFSNALGEGKPYILCEGVKLIPTPGHTGSDISVVIEGTSEGTVVFAGDLFEREEDLEDPSLWRGNSENPAIQEENRQKVLAFADYIVPGHGNIFKVLDKYKK